MGIIETLIDGILIGAFWVVAWEFCKYGFKTIMSKRR